MRLHPRPGGRVYGFHEQIVSPFHPSIVGPGRDESGGEYRAGRVSIPAFPVRMARRKAVEGYTHSKPLARLSRLREVLRVGGAIWPRTRSFQGLWTANSENWRNSGSDRGNSGFEDAEGGAHLGFGDDEGGSEGDDVAHGELEV